MLLRYLTISALLSPLVAFGAGAGTTAHQTWYVRPAAECPVNGDGTSYSCATAKGGHGAFSRLISLDWTPVTGIDDGDLLKVCGKFGISDARNSTTVLDVAGAGTDSAPITIDGNCSANGGSAKATIDAENINNYAVLVSNVSHVRIKNVTGINSNQSLSGANFNMGGGVDVQMLNDETYGGIIGVLVAGSGFVIDGMVTPKNNILTDVINVDGGAVSGVIRNCSLYSGNWNNADVIDIQGQKVASMLIENNRLRKGTGDKSTLTIKYGNGSYVIRNNDFDGVTSQTYGVRTQSTFSGNLQISSNVFRNYGTTSGNEIQLDSSIAGGTATIMSNIFQDGAYQLIIGDRWSVQALNNTFTGAAKSAIYSGGTAAVGPTLSVIKGNVIDTPVRNIVSYGFERSISLDYNNYYGAGDFLVENVVRKTLGAVQSNSSFEAHGVSIAP